MAATQNVLILGGVGGIGEALARRLSSKGSHVCITSRSLDRASVLAREIGALPAVVDIQDQASIELAVAEASPEGRLSGLAYCIGSIPLQSLASTTSELMMDAYKLNVVGAMVAVRAAAPSLRMAGGSVVLFSSVAARQGFVNHAAIGPAKAGVEGLTISLAAELAPKVRVNAIAPSLTRTPLSSSITQNATIAAGIAALHPIPRLGDADEVAGLAEFLLSAEAGWITGQIIGVDGGRAALRVGRA